MARNPTTEFSFLFCYEIRTSFKQISDIHDLALISSSDVLLWRETSSTSRRTETWSSNAGLATRGRIIAVILTGWKEISKHLRYGIRTVQRWERNGLPVRRVNGTPRNPVLADSEELDAWILHRIKIPQSAP